MEGRKLGFILGRSNSGKWFTLRHGLSKTRSVGRSEGVKIFVFVFKVNVDGLYPSLKNIPVSTVQDPEIRYGFMTKC